MLDVKIFLNPVTQKDISQTQNTAVYLTGSLYKVQVQVKVALAAFLRLIKM